MEPKDDGESTASHSLWLSEHIRGRWNNRSKRLVKKKISLIYLLNGICSSQETCIDWLKNRGLIPKIMFCPNCSQKMKFEPHESALDGYEWICKECRIDPPRYSTRDGSWLESKNTSLVDILLFTYLWAHGFSEAQIMKETNMEPDAVKEWDKMYTDICEALQRKDKLVNTECVAESTSKISKESPAIVWRKKNRCKDPFLEFLKDADSL